jgi:hypothetical protein
MQTDRRSFVKASGLVAVLGATGLAGCGGLGGGSGGSVQDWVYDPTGIADVPNVAFGTMAYGTLYDNRDELPQSMGASFETNPDSPMQPADIDDLVGVGGGDLSEDGRSAGAFGSIAVTGDVPRAELETRVESEGSAEPTGSYEGYSMYAVSELDDGVGGVPGSGQFQGSGAVAIGEDAMLAGFSYSQGMDVGATGESALETMIDAAGGDARRLSATSGPAQRVQDRLGDAMIVVGAEVDPALLSAAQELGAPDMFGAVLAGLRGGGLGLDVDGDTSTYRFALVYDGEGSATDAGIVDMVSELSTRLEDREGVERVDATQDGEVVVVTLVGDTETLARQGAGGPMLSVGGPS